MLACTLLRTVQDKNQSYGSVTMYEYPSRCVSQFKMFVSRFRSRCSTRLVLITRCGAFLNRMDDLNIEQSDWLICGIKSVPGNVINNGEDKQDKTYVE